MFANLDKINIALVAREEQDYSACPHISVQAAPTLSAKVEECMYILQRKEKKEIPLQIFLKKT